MQKVPKAFPLEEGGGGMKAEELLEFYKPFVLIKLTIGAVLAYQYCNT